MSRHQAALASVILATPRNVFFQRHGVVVASIFRAKEQRDGSLFGHSREMFHLVALIIELRGVSLFEFLPASGIMSEPFPQFGAGRDFLEPFIDAGFSFRQSTRPDAINQHAPTIGFGRLFVNALELNTHVPLSQHKLCLVARILRTLARRSQPTRRTGDFILKGTTEARAPDSSFTRILCREEFSHLVPQSRD